jgi:hypothetical protein
MKLRAFLTVLALTGASMASAQTLTVPTTLSGLIAAGSTGVTIGDKTFYDFTVSGDIAASNINVVQAPGSDLGLEFQANWTSTNGNNLDTLIRYKVHVNTAPTQQAISSVGLAFDGTGTGTNIGTNASVTETIDDLMGNQLGQISVFDAGTAGGTLNRDTASFTLSAPVRDLWLTKDISVHSLVSLPVTEDITKLAAVAPDTSSISFVDNTFHQVTTGASSVPVPPAALMALTTLGLGAFAPIRRRVFGR